MIPPPTSGPPNSLIRERAVLVAQLELLQGNLPGIIFGSVVAGAIAVLSIGDVATTQFKLLWSAAMLSILLGRFVHLLHLRRRPTTAANANECLTQLTLLSALTALAWGLFGAATISPEAPLQSLVVMMLLTGLVASGTAFISHFRAMYFAYIIGIMGPVTVRFLSFGEPEFNLVAGLVLVYLVVSVSTSRSNAESVVHSIRVRFENLDQYAELLEEKARADDARHRAELANESKSQFLSSASHDLRQPLHSLRLYAATLSSRLGSRQNSGVPDARATEDLRLVSRIDESVTALEGLFEGILDLSRLDAGTVQMRFEHLSLAQVFEQLELAFAPAAEIKGIRLEHDAAGHTVYTDGVMLHRMLNNLMSNAVRYTDQGRISLSASRKGSLVEIVVADTGIGIPEDQHDSVFQEFVQLNNPERDRRQGVGLGLSIVQRIAKLVGAEVSLESPDDQVGSTFTIRLRAGDDAKLLPVDASSSDNEASIADVFVLIIDDEESARDALESLIQNRGGSVLLAGSTQEALDALSEIDEVPDVVVSDYRLRGSETGTQAIAAVRDATTGSMPGLLITGDVAAQRLRDIHDSGLPVLHKPCDPEVLIKTLVDLSSSR